MAEQDTTMLKTLRLKKGCRCKLNYHNITKDDMNNGDGLRVVLWVAGCEHQCINCHNPETWNLEDGLALDVPARKEIFEHLCKSYISGITFTGGDPFHTENREVIGELIEKIHYSFPDKTIWAYTGYLWNDVKDLAMVKHIDVLVDGKFCWSLLDSKLHWRGSANQRVIDVKKSLEFDEVIIWGNGNG